MKCHGTKLDDVRTEASHILANAGVSCSTAALLAFGIRDRHPVTGDLDWSRSANEIKAALERNGFEVEYEGYREGINAVTLAAFLRERTEGDYFMVTIGRTIAHSMALRDGQLTDTDLVSGNRRRMNLIYRVK